MSVISMKQLLEAGVHFGHQTRRWNPKMAPYIFTERNGIHIIDLQKSVGKIDEAYNAVSEIAAQGGTILFVGTKKQAQDAVKAEAERCGMYYVNERWLGGMLTNFKTIQSRVKRLKEIEAIAQQIADTILAECYTRVAIGIGSAVNTIKDLAQSYKEAQISLEVGKVFDTEKQIISYDNLGIGRLIYQLPTALCNMFLQEVFKKGSIESLDHETLFTIQRFFENNLNVSETSRKLFVHRNTLVYRLEKIKKITGLDLREFEDAIVFKVALMVKKYLSSNPVKF